jgi:hypothetical protein
MSKFEDERVYQILLLGMGKSGKTTIANSLYGEFFETFITAYSSQYCYSMGNLQDINHNIRIDNILFKIIDTNDFNDSMRSTLFDVIVNVDIVLWVTEFRTAATDYTAEINFYKYVKECVETTCKKDRKRRTLQLLISKFNLEPPANIVQSTTHRFKNIQQFILDTGVDLDDVIFYNAFGAILNSISSSKKLKSWVDDNQTDFITDNNIKFNLQTIVSKIDDTYRVQQSVKEYIDLVIKVMATINKENTTTDSIYIPLQNTIAIGQHGFHSYNVFRGSRPDYKTHPIHNTKLVRHRNLDNILYKFIMITKQSDLDDFVNLYKTAPIIYTDKMWDTLSAIIYIDISQVERYINCSIFEDKIASFRVYNAINWTQPICAQKYYYQRKLSYHVDIQILIYGGGLNFGVFGDWVPTNKINIDIAFLPMDELLSDEFVDRVVAERRRIGLKELSRPVILARIVANRSGSQFISLL